ncbi:MULTISPECIES: flavin reductase family protein [Nocardia]|jgi:flavin reductase (DIM6/NTAB) family NADH-FMN oxidoreductase RutF|uniref:Flavin reductase n=2 Tax=Nocardia TaxID=1817 RepID=A0A2T2ZCF7_9NOCA|nr:MULTISPECIES: flavin reductase family protein [Nocardia]MDN2496807.1 flavin reductase family protein [Nocardia nova]PSR65416.1 flavin reductase [Nocardia nova]
MSNSIDKAEDLSARPDRFRSVSAVEYRAALRRHAAGVTIVTLNSRSGPVGFTATSFASLSLDPPLVSFNITCTSSSLGALQAAESVVVHLLGAHQLQLAQRFSRSADQRFSDESLWSPLDTGEPVLHGTPTWIHAEVQQLIPAGDSVLAVCRVVRVYWDEDGERVHEPLLYHKGAYSCAVPLDE